MLKGFRACHENALIQSFEMSPHLIVWRSHTQTLLWPASGAGWPLKGLGVASPDHQVGALFEALDEGVLMVPLKSIGYFFATSSYPEVRWQVSMELSICAKSF